MIDNLFIVESPLQALVAVELGLQFNGKNNGIIYRLSGKGRERNDDQICKVIDRGQWSFVRQVAFSASGAVAHHLSVRKFILSLRKEFASSVQNVFFGEFRSQWMHFTRLALAPEKCVLMDDGAATVTAKSEYIDKNVFFPRDLWISKSPSKDLVKNAIYMGLFDKKQLPRPLSFASAFLKHESEYKVDFSSVRKQFSTPNSLGVKEQAEVYFFGSKYSEAGILTLDYELGFISHVIDYYAQKGLTLIYCAHRDESSEKLDAIKSLGDVSVVRPELPAELFILEHHENVAEIASAYSSVINNLSLMFPDKPVTSFRLNSEAVNPLNRNQIERIYKHYAAQGIVVAPVFPELRILL
jgi:hypothetical protein